MSHLTAKLMNLTLATILFFFSAAWALASSLDSQAAPTDADSAMYTLEDLYKRLDDGTAGSKRVGAFTEPASGPTAGTGKTLDDVMGKAPTVDAADGAAAADVLAGKNFWGLLPGTGWGPLTGSLPRWTCYDNNKSEVECDSEDRVVATDNLTGLMWTTNAYLAGTRSSLDGALSYCNNLVHGGYTDWVLPNIRELLSLIDYGQSDPALPSGHPFTNVQLGISFRYRTSTTYSGNLEHAWVVEMDSGSDFIDYKSNSYVAWPVRAGQ